MLSTVRVTDKLFVHVQIQGGGERGGQGGVGVDRGPDPPLENYKAIGFLSNTGLDPLKNHKATRPAFNVGPSSACQPHAGRPATCWQADDGLLLVVFGSSLPSSTNKMSELSCWILSPLINK